MKCQNCGADSTTKFCPYCGSEMPYRGPETVNNNTNTTVVNNYYYTQPPVQPVVNQPVYIENTSRKSRLAAWLWCFFLGLFGAHYFYVGKTGMGFLYLFTAGLFGIGWIVDLIRIPLGGFKDKYSRIV